MKKIIPESVTIKMFYLFENRQRFNKKRGCFLLSKCQAVNINIRRRLSVVSFLTFGSMLQLLRFLFQFPVEKCLDGIFSSCQAMDGLLRATRPNENTFHRNLRSCYIRTTAKRNGRQPSSYVSQPSINELNNHQVEGIFKKPLISSPHFLHPTSIIPSFIISAVR